jgi:hypothetical protein
MDYNLPLRLLIGLLFVRYIFYRKKSIEDFIDNENGDGMTNDGKLLSSGENYNLPGIGRGK